jgi:hypothetical protein
MKGLITPGLIVASVLLWSAPAYAYIDPGTGSMVLQLLLGGIAGAAVMGRMYWSRLKARFRRNARTEGGADEQRD